MKRVFFFLIAGVLSAQVTYDQLRKAAPGNWLHYNGQYHSQRHSLLDQVNTRNAKKLAAQWIYHVPEARRLETVP
ncbi:MAG: hypothetical protein IT167_11385, partial [Bryobacterales bacterium]|nr:hypothetical protein [Bryobacterales bacterium]